MATSETFRIVEAFEVQGRGTIVTVDHIAPDFMIGTGLIAQFTTNNGEKIECAAHSPMIRRCRPPGPDDKHAYLLSGIEKTQIEEGSLIRIERTE